MNYYNENDPKAAAWLRELIAGGHISPGVVDERSICEVQPDDVREFRQCHFFAGIGGWSLALRLAGWPDDEPVWTMSCPCQPFSGAGKQLGRKDPRHLWPAGRRLINRVRPAKIFGEQVASAAGREWLAGVFANLETMGYAPAGADLCAAGVGSPNIRQRLWWCAFLRVDLADRIGSAPRFSGPFARQEGNSRIPDYTSGQKSTLGGGKYLDPVWLVYTQQPGLEGHARHEQNRNQSRWVIEKASGSTPPPGATNFWSRCVIVPCEDGCARRAEPESFPLVDGVPGRVGLLRGYGNAIVPQVAAQFIQAASEAGEDLKPQMDTDGHRYEKMPHLQR